MKKLIIFTLIGGFCIFVSGCMEVSSVKREKFSCMDTYVEIIVDKSVAKNLKFKNLFEEIKGKCKNFENKYSYYNENSIVRRINEHKKVRVDDETKELLQRAKKISRLTGGAFDFTVVPLMKLWGFYEKKKIKKIPEKKKIKSLLEVVGYQKVKVDGKNNLLKKKSKEVKIDLSGIAKGLLVDKIVKIMKEEKVHNAIVNAGGDMYCLGKSPDGKNWSIGIQHPRKRNVILGKMDLSNMAIATSGDYEQYFTIDGKRYTHIINPVTGYPVSNRAMGVTIVATDTATADALATAVMVLGSKKGLKLINDLSKVEAIVISEGGKDKVKFSKGLKEGKYNFTYKDK